MRKKLLISISVFLFLILLLINYMAYNHAYKFTHYSHIPEKSLKIKENSKLSSSEIIKYVFYGVDVPRPENDSKPLFEYQTTYFQTSKGKLEIWESVPIYNEPLGTVMMFHGYANKKSSLALRAYLLHELGYKIVLVDFLGSGGSDGDMVSIGYYEADQVKICYDSLKARGEKNIYLFGISMGAASIMKCMKDHQLDVKGLILECPFGSMKTTIKKRFDHYHIPKFPMVDLMMLWGSYHAGYWTYNHQPSRYAKSITTPTLLIYGENDLVVSRKEIDQIYSNLKGPKQLEIFPNSDHDVFVGKNHSHWRNVVNHFFLTQ